MEGDVYYWPHEGDFGDLVVRLNGYVFVGQIWEDLASEAIALCQAPRSKIGEGAVVAEERVALAEAHVAGEKTSTEVARRHCFDGSAISSPHDPLDREEGVGVAL